MVHAFYTCMDYLIITALPRMHCHLCLCSETFDHDYFSSPLSVRFDLRLISRLNDLILILALLNVRIRRKRSVLLAIVASFLTTVRMQKNVRAIRLTTLSMFCRRICGIRFRFVVQILRHFDWKWP